MKLKTLEIPLEIQNRLNLCKNTLAKKCFSLILEKKSNLVLTLDLTQTQDILEQADSLGPYISILKLHVDIIEDFTCEFINNLKSIALKQQFLIFEDRKFTDIGNTVAMQYEKGIYHIVEWADIVNCSVLPGEGVITGLKKPINNRERGLLLLAQMSSKGAFTSPDFIKKNLELSERHADFVFGFICQEKLSNNPAMIHMTPGVKLKEGEDKLGQQYNTPEKAIFERGSDMIIVGRGITESNSPEFAAKEYQLAGYEALLKRSEG
jgi:uridine monophosphate synthetase